MGLDLGDPRGEVRALDWTRPIRKEGKKIFSNKKFWEEVIACFP
jgi:hypothetical protein